MKFCKTILIFLFLFSFQTTKCKSFEFKINDKIIYSSAALIGMYIVWKAENTFNEALKENGIEENDKIFKLRHSGAITGIGCCVALYFYVKLLLSLTENW